MNDPRAILCTRVSTTGQATDGTSLESQEADCLRRAAQEKARIVHIYREEGVSGTLYLARPDIQAALSRIESGEANLLIFPKIDRVGRNVEVIRAIRKRVDAAGARLLFADGMNFENNAVGNLTFTQIAAFAEFERETIRERTMAGRRRRAEEGQQASRAQRPYGYLIITREMVLRGEWPAETLGTYQVHEPEARWVREMFARYAAGTTLRQLAFWLHGEGVPTPRGGREWQPECLSRILQNPVHKGEPTFGRLQRFTDEERRARGRKTLHYYKPAPDEDVIRLNAPALVSPEVWDACQSRFEENRAVFSGRADRRWLLTGLLKCPNCGRAMKGQRRNKSNMGRAYYACKEHAPSQSRRGHVCHPTRYFSEVLEAATVDALRQLSESPESVHAAFAALAARLNAATPADAERDRLQADLATLDKRERAAVEGQIAGIQAGADPAVYGSVFADIRQTRDALQKRLAALGTPATTEAAPDPEAQAGELLARLGAVAVELLTAEELTIAERHGLLARLVRAIVPDTWNGQDALRLEIIGSETVTYVCVSSV